MLSLASKLLTTIATPSFEKAYEEGCSIWDANDELDKLRRTIQTIQAVFLDAEKKQDTSAAVNGWIERVRDVLYDADDLFDEVATDYMLKQQTIMGGILFKKVPPFCSKLNPILSRNSIENKVNAIRKSLLEICNDIRVFGFLESVVEQPVSSEKKGVESGSFVDSKEVIGRDEDKKTILEWLLDDNSNNGEQDVSIIAIVGIGGMGKTTLIELVYNDEKVEKSFEKRWFACISNTFDNKEIIGKIFQSVSEESYSDFTLSQLETKISMAVNGEKFLLVLDDVWDENCANWQHRLSLLKGCVKGSKIIVTTRSLSVKRAVGALQAHNLEGLSENESWDLFKRIAFTTEQENDPRWTNLGREIVKKCANVPLAIRSVAILLKNKATINEWESLKDNEMSKLELSDDSVMQTLKLSYDHLPFNLKPCFAYCSLFPKDYNFHMDELVYLWIALGYIKPGHQNQTVEQAGYSYFMDLHRRSYLEKRGSYFWYTGYSMHDLLHDLAQRVAKEEIIALTKPPNMLTNRARHVYIGDVDSSWGSVAQMLNTNRLRSLVFLDGFLQRNEDQCSLLALDQQSTYGKYLRALSLSDLKIQTVSSSIWELKHLRYLNLAYNSFESLPESLANLVNLLTLDIRGCIKLKALPTSFKKLINLRHLEIEDCIELRHMPPGMAELTCLQRLSDFKVGEVTEGVQRSGLDVLAGLQLRGELKIEFETIKENWDGDECWQLPASLEQLVIYKYPCRRIQQLSIDPSFLPNLSCLTLAECSSVKHLAPLRCFPNLKLLKLHTLPIEYIEEDGEDGEECTTVDNASFFPVLEKLEMNILPKLKGWSRRKVAAKKASSTHGTASPDLLLSFPLLSELYIGFCEELTSFPLCPYVRTLDINDNVGVGLLRHLFSGWSTTNTSLQMSISGCEDLVSFPDNALASLNSCSIKYCYMLENLHLLASTVLKELVIDCCHWLTGVEVEALPSLVSLEITGCRQLKNLRIASLNSLRYFGMWGCSKELELWGMQQEKMCVDWNSLPNLCLLKVDRRLPSPEGLPNCLQHRQALGQLLIIQKIK